jgi:transcriptional regulator of acetoin/glycerol metabolism
LDDEKQPAAALPLESAEIQAIRSTLQKNDFNRNLTAKELGISRNTLWRKMKKHGIFKE